MAETASNPVAPLGTTVALSKPKRTRNRIVIGGGIVAPSEIRPHSNHPLGHLTATERLDAAHHALGSLILKAIEKDTSTHAD